MSNSIADKFKARLDEEAETGEYRGFPLRLRRMRAKVLYASGRMPQYFADIYRTTLGADPENPANEKQDRKLTAAEHKEFADFQMSIVLDSCLEPRLVEANPKAEEVLISSLPDDVLEFIYLYACRLANFEAGQQSQEVSAQELTPFLQHAKRAKPSHRPVQRGKARRKPSK